MVFGSLTMTEAEEAASESAHTAPPPSDVEMQSTDATSHEQVEGSNGDASIVTSAVENDGEDDEQHAPTSDAPESVSEEPSAEKIDENASVMKDGAQELDAVPSSTEAATESAAEPVPDAAVEEAAEVKSEQPEQAAVAKRKEPSSPDLAPKTEDVAVDAAVTTDNTVAESAPVAKKQKVDAMPSRAEEPSPAPAPAPEAPPAALSTGVSSEPLMISRDDMAKMEEDSGLVKFDVITNDGRADHMMQLTTLKNIFARQLPKMPREYIVRLVFDRNHRSMIILKNGKTVIGGICYRPFEPNHFAEIAFCAINATDQVKGYGTRLMNHLKEYVKASGITHFLTYADNYAIGYFKKQGFAKVVSMPRPNWFGYIKDYDGGTLMECTIHHQINYLRITSMVQQQRKKIQDKIKERSHTDIVYPGLSKFAEGRTMDLYMIPGVQEAGWSRAVIRNNRVGTRDPGSLKTQLQQLWKHVSSHRSAWPFHEPVDTEVVVDYLDYIKEPVDLSLVQKRIESGHYLSKQVFKEDLLKMCNNCMLYNTPDTNYYKAAKDLQEFIEKRVQVAK